MIPFILSMSQCSLSTSSIKENHQHPGHTNSWLNSLVSVMLSCVLSQFSSVQLLSHVRLFATPWIATCQASLSITNSWSWFKLMLIKSVMPSSHLILCCPLLLQPPIPPSIRVFSNESTLRMRWPKYWSFSFSTSFKLSSGHRTRKGQFSFQSLRKAILKNAQTTAQLHSSHTLVK